MAQNRRREAAAAATPEGMAALVAAGLGVLGERAPGAVSGFWPIRDEIDVRPLLDALRDLGWTVLLPAVMGQDVPLQFRVWQTDGPLVRADFGIMQSPPGAATGDPDVALVPLLAFDARGYRIGYGKGHYDRTLSLLRRRRRILAVGVAYAAQEVPQVPTEPHDERLDGVLTERGWNWTGVDA